MPQERRSDNAPARPISSKEPATLSGLEVDVLTLYQCGANVDEIAAWLHMDAAQVRSVLTGGYNKLAFGNREELLRPLYRLGFPFDRERVPAGGYRH